MRRRVATLLAASLLAVAPAARAQPDPRARQAAAVREFEAGERQFAAGRYDAAADRFKAAYDLFPDPVYLFNVGVAYEQQGRWALAIEYYDRFLAEAPDSAAASDVRRRRDAAQVSREADQATVVVTSTPPGAAAVVNAPSGEARCTTPCEVRVDPGATTVSLRLGSATTRLARTLGPRERWEAAGELATATLGPVAGVEAPVAPSNTASWVAWGGAGLALATAGVFGAMAYGDHRDLREIERLDAPTADDARRHAALREEVAAASLVADVALAVGVAGAVAGWLLWQGPSEAGEPTSGLTVGPTGVGWRW